MGNLEDYLIPIYLFVLAKEKGLLKSIFSNSKCLSALLINYYFVNFLLN